MYQEPQKFAKLAGQDVQKFAQLLKQDANEALMQFLQAMQSKGGFDALAPMFQEMGLSGTRCVGVLSTLATNLEEVKRQQDIAAKAFEDGTSVLDEYNVQNNTVQAGIDKAKKQFLEVSVALGEKLLPVVKYTISSTTLMVKGLSVLVDVVVTARTTIIAATIALIAWNAAAFKAMIVEKLTAAFNACRTAVLAVNAAIKANHWMALATVIGLAGAALADYLIKQKNVTATQKAYNEIEDETNKQLLTEKARIESLFKRLKDQTYAYGQRKDALNELKKIMPGYNGELTKEGKLINDNTSSMKDYLKELEKSIRLKASQDKLMEL